MNLRTRSRTIAFPRRPLVMGILNLSADSFSGDALPDADRALRRARQMVEEGAAILARLGLDDDVAWVLPHLVGTTIRFLSCCNQFGGREKDVLLRPPARGVQKAITRVPARRRSAGRIINPKKRNKGLIECVVLAAHDDGPAVFAGHVA